MVTCRKIRNIGAMKGKRVHKIVSSEGLALHGGELEMDCTRGEGRLCNPPCWKPGLGES